MVSMNFVSFIDDDEKNSGARMFKRALQTNHWMAIGLDEWNKLENMEIPQSLIKKYRKVERGEDVNDDDEDSVELENESVVDSDNESGEEEEEEQEEAISSEEEQHVFLRYCDTCPGRKFLTEKDFQEHINSKRHQKKIAKEVNTSEDKPVVEVKTPSKQSKDTKKVAQPTEVKNNRKTRRAHLATLEKSRSD